MKPRGFNLLRTARRNMPLLLTVVAGVLLSAAGFFFLSRAEGARIAGDFTNLARDRADAIRAEMDGEFLELAMIDSYVNAAQELTENRLDAFGSEFQAFIRGSQIGEKDTQAVAIALSEGGHFRIAYVAPPEIASPLLGMDLSAFPDLAASIESALSSDSMIVTENVDAPRVWQDSPLAWAFAPLNRAPASGGSAGSGAIGLVVYIFRIDKAVERALEGLSLAGIDLELGDPSLPEGTQVLYFHSSRSRTSPAAHPLRTGLTWKTSFKAADRTWTFQAFPAPLFFTDHAAWQSWVLLAGGLLITALVSVIVSGWTRRAVRVENLVAERTVELSREIAEHTRLESALQESQATLLSRVEQLRQKNNATQLLNEVGELLQACVSIEEAYPLISMYLPRLLPASVGALYLKEGSKGLLGAVAEWTVSETRPGEDLPRALPAFKPEDCWALRRGGVHVVGEAMPALACPHVSVDWRPGSICVPLAFMGETAGVFHVARCREEANAFALSVAERIGLGLSNLRLRSELRELSIHDPLTNLHNRRYMEEALELELRRSERSSLPVGIIMMDIDRFKAFNDGFGHAAGDDLLRGLASLVRSNLRAGDIACRYGGEEFLLILPNTTAESALAKSEDLRRRVESMEIHSLDVALDRITVSLGVAASPVHGGTRDELLAAADAALYDAKKQGRNRSVMAEPNPHSRKE